MSLSCKSFTKSKKSNLIGFLFIWNIVLRFFDELIKATISIASQNSLFWAISELTKTKVLWICWLSYLCTTGFFGLQNDLLRNFVEKSRRCWRVVQNHAKYGDNVMSDLRKHTLKKLLMRNGACVVQFPSPLVNPNKCLQT